LREAPSRTLLTDHFAAEATATEYDPARRFVCRKEHMRLTAGEQSAIREAIHEADAHALIYLFGSRVDDAANGGDIDLLVLSGRIDLMSKLDILARLHQQFGERRIDLVVYPDASRPFPRMVLEEGVPL